MKKKRNSFCKYLKLTLNKLKNSSMPSSQKEKRKLYYSPENEKEILSIKNKILNEKKTHKLQFSYCAFFAPNNILNLRKKSKISSNRTRKNNLILTSMDNSSKVKKNENIFPYKYYNKLKKRINITKNESNKRKNNFNVKPSKNNISLTHFLSVKKTKNKIENNIPPEVNQKNENNKITTKLNTEKRNNKKGKNYFTSSYRTRKNSRESSEKGKAKEKEKGREHLIKKLNVFDFKKLIKPHSKRISNDYFTFKSSSHNKGYELNFDSNNKSKNKYGINNFADYLRASNIFKNKKNIHKSINLSSYGNNNHKKIINKNNYYIINRIKALVNVNNSCTVTFNNSKNCKNSMVNSIKNLATMRNKKNNKKVNSLEHKKTKSINIGPMSYPFFNCFFNIINNNNNNNNPNSNANNNNNMNNNLKSKLNNITIDMNYGRSKKKIIFFCDKNNNNNHRQSSEPSTTNEAFNNSNNFNSKANLQQNNLNKNKKQSKLNNNIVSNYFININNQIDNNNNNLYKKYLKNISFNSMNLKFNKNISQCQDFPPPLKIQKKNYTTKNSPNKVFSQRITTDNNNNNNNSKNSSNNYKNLNLKKSKNNSKNNSKSKKKSAKNEIKKKDENKNAKDITRSNKIRNSGSNVDDVDDKKIVNNILDQNKNADVSRSSNISTTMDYKYYMKESKNLSNYIKSYYEKNKVYPPTKINFYKYGRLIGQGAFGKVNIGLNVLSGRIVAIKSFNKDKLKKSNENLKKILHETNIMRELNHPNITKILEVFEDDKFILIIMEYINGGNLFSLVKKRRKLPEKIAKFLFKQIILGIKHMHSKNIVHRDIKLENILIDLNNRIKICDFGIGVVLKDEDELLYDQCGTPMYIAPEIILSSKNRGYRGFPVDIWAAGIALYIMLSGTLPFNIRKKEAKGKNVDASTSGKELEDNEERLKSEINRNNYELQYSIINKEPKKIEKISPEARDLLKGLLNKDPKKRLKIDEILNHPWLKLVDLNSKNNKYKIFTKAEMIMLSKNYIDYRVKGDEDLKEIFTLSNLNDSKEGNNENNINIKTKSSVLSPYNTLIDNESIKMNEDGDIPFDNGELFNDFYNSKIHLENNIINLGNKVKDLYINYELNNNGELDNGMIIQMKSKSNSLVNMTTEVMNSASDDKSDHNEPQETDDREIKDEKNREKILEIVENFGYNKKYVIDCIENNKLCHASTVYYLLINYENYKNI